MIVRDMLDNPTVKFDYFNDYKDTLGWLKSIKDTRAAAAIRILEIGHILKWIADNPGIHPNNINREAREVFYGKATLGD